MKDFRGNIEKICNYTEDTKNPYQPSISLSYIDMVTEDEDVYQREIKRQNRELAIDIILDEKNESEWENRNNNIGFGFDSGYTSTISPKIFRVNTIGKNFTSFEDLENEVFIKLENLTKNKPVSNNSMVNSLDIVISSLNSLYDFEALQRKVVSKIMACKNIVEMENKKGPTNTIILGINVAKYIEEISSRDNVSNMFVGLDIVITPYIDPDKIIVMRVENSVGTGLNVILKPNDNKYYMVETPQSWEKTMKWFWIK
jgi:hypothetical protein